MRKSIVSAVALGVLACASPGGFDFAVVGDLPYRSEGLAKLRSVIGAVNAADVEWVLHIGDIKSGGALCADTLLRGRYESFQAFTHPFVFVPGDNDWTDCHRESNGGYDPLERLSFLRDLFYAVPGRTSGSVPMTVSVQAERPEFSQFVEHQRWVHGGVVFITLHVVGSNNGLVPFGGRTSEHDAEVYEREAAMVAWLSEGFKLARESNSPGVVVAIHANPRFDDPYPPSEIPVPDSMRVGYEAFLETLESETIAFRRPVLLIHGDSHYFRIDKPLYNSDTRRRLENFTRLETFGAPDFHWINVRVDPEDPRVFRISERLIPENFEGYDDRELGFNQ